MKCQLCGYEFDDSRAICAGCPLAKNCKVICCPNCGYEFVKESVTVNFVTKLLGTVRKRFRAGNGRRADHGKT